MNLKLIPLALLAVLVVSGCAGEPSEEEIIQECVDNHPMAVAVMCHNKCAWINGGEPVDTDEFYACVDSCYIEDCKVVLGYVNRTPTSALTVVNYADMREWNIENES